MRFIFFLLFSTLITACAPKEPLYHTQSYVFGTLVDISIYGEPETRAKALTNAISRQFQSLHNRLHAWQPSELQSLNHAFAAGQTPITVHPDIAHIISEATQLSVQSNGAFNPAIGQLIHFWGFQQDTFKPIQIDAPRIQALVQKHPEMTDIVVAGNTIYSKNPAVQLDLGGYAKGYALDIAMAYLRANGVKNALINIGGNIMALGQHGDKPWRVGIQHPREPNAIASLDLPSGWAIGTSGDYQRYFLLNGQRYCHIIDPNTGYPVQHMQSVTVLVPPAENAGVLSDVASKPIFIAKPNARRQAARAMHIDNYLMVVSHNQIEISAAMAKRITWLDPHAQRLAKVVSP